jgi:hypothetical protein
MEPDGLSSRFVIPIPGVAPAVPAESTLIRYTVQSGDYLSLIAQDHQTTVQALVDDNYIADPNVILRGQVLVVYPGKQVPNRWRPTVVVSSARSYSPYHPAVYGAGIAGCIIAHESRGNPYVYNSSGSGAWGLYQFMPGTWAAAGGNPADFGHASPGEQTAVFNTAYARWGASPWAGDGC